MSFKIQSLRYSSINEDEGWNGVKKECLNNSFVLSVDKLDGICEPPREKNAIAGFKKKENKKRTNDQQALSFFSLFRFATGVEKILTLVGCIVAVICGFAYPAVVVQVGELIDIYISKEIEEALRNGTFVNIAAYRSFENVTKEIFLQECRHVSIAAGIIGLMLFIFNYIMVTCLSIAAERQTLRIKCTFMRSILKQDIGWFDTNQTGDISSRITVDLTRIREGIGEKVCMYIYFMSTSLISLGYAFYFGWKLTLVITSIMPILIISTAIMSKIQANLSVSELSAYGKAGAVAEEVFSSIRTVVAFGGEQKEMERYDKNLNHAKKSGTKRGLATSVGASLLWFCMYSSYALAFWYGVNLILQSRKDGTHEYTPKVLIIVFFNVLQAALYMGQASPYFEAFSIARGAALNIFSIIARIPYIDSSSDKGMKLSSLIGNIELKDVYFKYPARQDVKVLNGLSLVGKAGETVALVGPSGCGKSTIIQLIQRFYDPLHGKVLVDGRNIQELNVGWLREHIGIVGQEPVLFATSIKENIRHGFPQATDLDIEKAAKSANAHDFISKLPKQYDTIVGERGAQLSGGQKQRIAIARALVRNPRILLLDEATSALDTESESIVQAALDHAREGRTTFVVAHRLSTIRNADKIMVINKGVVEEIGNHTELMNKKGLYYNIVVIQNADDRDSGKETFQVKSGFIGQVSTMSTVSSASSNNIPNGIREDERKEELKDENEEPNGKRLITIASKEWPYLAVGVICSLLMGLSIPIYGVIFGDVVGVLSGLDDEKIKKESPWYSIAFVILAVSTGAASFLQTFMFSVAGERLTKRLRRDVFAVMVKQHIGWFEEPQNGTGALCSRLASDAAQIQGATGSRMAAVCQALSTLIAAVVIGLYFNWKIGLVVLSFVPLVLVATYLESRMIGGHLLQEKKSTEVATGIVVEAIENIRTVASLHQEASFCSEYTTALGEAQKSFKKRCHIRGLIFGFAQSISTLGYAVAMVYGSVLIAQEGMAFGDLFKVAESIIFGTMMMGEAVAFAPNYQKAKAATVRIFKLLDMRSNIDATKSSGLKMPPLSGQIRLQSVHFNYPTRPEVKILNNLHLTAEPGQTVALVGSSGCGKSTCIQLLERFYDSQDGEVLVDGMNVKNLDVSWLRSQVGLVSQEPVLFGYSIAENIAYGDNKRSVSMAEIIEAARKANIHQFVSSLPAGYDTNVGDRGTQLSGGQKQRIAIARALVRNPKILLLDEATSALDTESEKVVQDALDQARVGRTCIVIAHRLSTIRNADKILVVHKGRVIEEGTHNELFSKRGLYYRLCAVQTGQFAK